MGETTLEAIRFDRKGPTLLILDQLQLPYLTVYIDITSVEDAYDAIKSMKVRGAPAIAIVGAFSVALEVKKLKGQPTSLLNERIDYLVTSRPTAVNLSNAANEIKALIKDEKVDASLIDRIEEYAVALHSDDLTNNYKIGANGLKYITETLEEEEFEGPFSIMTVCNTGSLATSGHGTALGIIRSVHAGLSGSKFWLEKVYPLETRPYNQGAKLTTYELQYEKIPFTLICDNMVTSLICRLGAGVKGSTAPVKFIIVGADRVVKNGDTANKIGTHQLAAIANYYESHNIKFIVAAPNTTIDHKTKTGADIVIEERPSHELTTLTGPVIGNGTAKEKKTVGIATPGIDVWNPAFDVTPHELIDCVVTEDKVHVKNASGEFTL